MKKITVVVPVHNTGDFIEECIESILKQTYKNMEVICIDSSTDNKTTSILEVFEKQDDRLIIIKDDNSSYGYKVNVGIKKSSGDYISIVDSDDYLEKEMLERLQSIIEEQKVDFVKSDYSSFYVENGKNVIKDYEYNAADEKYYEKSFSTKEKPEILYQNAVSIWSGLYKKDFILSNEIFLNESEGASFQDTGFSVLTHVLANKIYYVKESYYRYRIDNSNSSVKSQKKCNTIADESRWIDLQIYKRGIVNHEILNAVKIKKIISYHWNYERLEPKIRAEFCDYVHEELLNEYIDSAIIHELPQYIKSRFDELIFGGELYQFNQKKINEIDKILRNNVVTLVGAGRLGKKILEYDKENGIDGISEVCDNFVDEISIFNEKVQVLNVNDISKKATNLYVIANKNSAFELERQLQEKGISSIYICKSFPIEKM